MQMCSLICLIFLHMLHPNSSVCFLQTPPPPQHFFGVHPKFWWGILLKELRLPLCSFTGDTVRQTNKGSERPTLLFGADYILYSVIPKRRSFVVENQANCRVWWYYCTVLQQSCQDEIQLPSTLTNTRGKGRLGAPKSPIRTSQKEKKTEVQQTSQQDQTGRRSEDGTNKRRRRPHGRRSSCRVM